MRAANVVCPPTRCCPGRSSPMTPWPRRWASSASPLRFRPGLPTPTDARDSLQALHVHLKRAHPGLDLSTELLDLPLHELDVLEQVTQHEALVLTDRPLQCRLELISLAPQSATGELRQPGRCRLPPRPASEHVTAAEPHDIGGDIPKLDVACAVQQLLSAIATWPLMIAPTPMEADGVCPSWPARRGQGQASTTPS